MDHEIDASSERKRKRASNYRVRFRHGVYPDPEDNATRADIKKYDYFFSAAQPWVHTSENGNAHIPDYVNGPLTQTVGFVDETAHLSSDNDSVSSVAARRAHPPKSTRTRRAERVTKVPSNSQDERRTHGIQRLVNPDQSSGFISRCPTSPSSPLQTAFLRHRQKSPAASSESTCSLEGRSSVDWKQDCVHPEVTSQDTPYQGSSSHISDPIEAKLFRYWVKCVGPRIDIVSPENVFTEVVPRMASNNNMVMNAILMIASQCILRVEPLFPAKPYVYQERTLQLLVAYLASHGKIDDEESLVTAILLRGFEESHAGTGGQEHLSTFELFHNHRGWQYDMRSVLVQACFMIHVHFEIYHALLCRPSLRVDYRTWTLPALERPSNDVSWANKIVWACARILQLMDSGRCRLMDWYELSETVDEWECQSPESFKSLQHGLSSRTERTSLQDARLQQCYVDALQHLCICRMALAALHATVDHEVLLDNRRGDIAVQVRNLVTIARLNMFSGWSLQIASHALHRFGTELDLLEDRLDVMEFLEIVNNSVLPTIATQERLKMYWGWQL